MNRRNCIKWSTVAAMLAWSIQAAAQEVAPVAPVAPMLPMVSDPWSAMMASAASSGPLAGVAAYIAWTLGRSIQGWTPTIRVVHVRQPQPEPWDGVERRGRASDR
jgi:hypothetical protein